MEHLEAKEIIALVSQWWASQEDEKNRGVLQWAPKKSLLNIAIRRISLGINERQHFGVECSSLLTS